MNLIVEQEENISINKLMSMILKKEIDKPKEYNALELINKNMDNITNSLTNIIMKQKLHLDITIQHFVNKEFSSNANPNNDKCLKELINKQNNYNK